MTKILTVLFLLGIYGFVLAPLAIVVMSSFNSAHTFPRPFEGLTLDWYRQLLSYTEFTSAFRLSTEVAVLSAGLATVVGVTTAIYLVRSHSRWKDSLTTLLMTPLVVPQIAFGLALLQLVAVAGARLSIWTLVVAHTVLVAPFVIRTTSSSLSLVDVSTEEAALDLGARRLRTFFQITLPQIRPGIGAGFVLAAIVSFINVPVSFFLSTPGNSTLPIRIFSYMESRLDPLVAAIATLVISAAIIVTLVVEKVFKIEIVL